MKTIKQIGDEMKGKEKAVESRLPHVGYAIIRVDGRAFHTLTRGMQKPMDQWFIAAMDNAAKRAMEGVGAVAAYVQSDEISLIVDPHGKRQDVLPFDGRVEKLVSLSAASAAVGFYEYYSQLKTNALYGIFGNLAAQEPVDGDYAIVSDDRITTVLASRPQFDSRVISLETVDEVRDYLTWRRMDCMKNAVSSYAQAQFSPSQLKGKSTDERWQMLSDVRGVDFKIPDSEYWGRLLMETRVEKDVTWIDAKTGEERAATAMRTELETQAATKDAVEELVSMLRDKADRANAPENA